MSVSSIISPLPTRIKLRLYAEANIIIYYLPKASGQVVLIKNAWITQNQDILTGSHIWYDIKKTNRDFYQSGRKKTLRQWWLNRNKPCQL
ncbi:LptA/OstA family protein [Coxiella-like endosymbiont]|uniref:LptA/OstA family protein n=1 Tax=Coxiella-like endosymbiont TaxID=1592897 RepID=UPI00272D5E1A|nr:LptA/OstA family protein [Coxiella-like endosymbiont]